jgi:acyl carrier protein
MGYPTKCSREAGVLELTGSKLNDIIRAVLELPPDANVASAGQDATPEWDSLAHAVMVGAIESEFGLQIDAAESLDLT